MSSAKATDSACVSASPLPKTLIHSLQQQVVQRRRAVLAQDAGDVGQRCEAMPTDSPSSIQKRAWMAWVRRASEMPTRKARASIDLGTLTASRAVPSRASRARGRETVGLSRSP